jgi:predicted PurR-regulated permease PerM
MEHQPDDRWKWTVNALLRLAVIGLIAYTAFDILRPLINLLVWSLILTISLTPFHARLTTYFRGRKGLAAVVISLFFLGIIIGPFSYVTNALVGNVKELRTVFNPETFNAAHMEAEVKEWPLVGARLSEQIAEISNNQEEYIRRYRTQIVAIGSFVVGLVKGTAGTLLLFVGAIIIAGVMLAFSDKRNALGVSIGYRIAGAYGAELSVLIEKTVRSVVGGVLGVALIQTALAGIGFFVMGIPYAGFWTLVTLFLALVQVGAGPTAIGAVIYGFLYHDTLPAVLFLIWNVAVMLSDNVLKPVLMGRGLGIPMLVILVGAIGGMLSNGILGLFLGPVILAVGYKLFVVWLEEQPAPEKIAIGGDGS